MSLLLGIHNTRVGLLIGKPDPTALYQFATNVIGKLHCIVIGGNKICIWPCLWLLVLPATIDIKLIPK